MSSKECEREKVEKNIKRITNHTVYNKKSILKNAIEPNPLDIGVYFLILDKDIVYIGKSTCVSSRVRGHLLKNKIPFDKYFKIECREMHLDLIESFYIEVFNPEFNVRSGDIPKSRLTDILIGEDADCTSFEDIFGCEN